MIDRRQDEVALRAPHQHEAERHKVCESALEDIALLAGQAIARGQRATALFAIREAANSALQRPRAGTRVYSLLQGRGQAGTIVGWHHGLGMPLIQWDEQLGLPPEACEPNEYTTDAAWAAAVAAEEDTPCVD